VGGGRNKDELLPVLLPILGQRLQVLLPFFYSLQLRDEWVGVK
jgi:hypothetical protein